MIHARSFGSHSDPDAASDRVAWDRWRFAYSTHMSRDVYRGDAAIPDSEQTHAFAAGRAPAMTLAVAFAAGITLDRQLPIPYAAAILAGGFALVVLAICIRRQRNRMAAVLAVALFVALGAARHHAFWSLRGSNDLAQFASDEPRLVEVIGVVESPVEIDAASQDSLTPVWMRIDRSQCLVAAEALVSANRREPVSGLVRLEVSGHLLHARTGDRIRIVGSLTVPGPIRNPGGFDYRTWLRGRGVDCVLRCNHPDAVANLERAGGWRHALGRWRDRLRFECLAVMRRELRPDNAAVAASLLLGDRAGMTDEIRDAYIESGTMHLLAISGVHVAMLAGMVYLACRALKLSTTSTGMVVLLIIVAYAFVTDHRPPVIRSAILAGMVVLAQLFGRRAPPHNTLACSALVVLLWRPADLFDVGAQLSFLAVLGILCAARWATASHVLWRDPFRRDRNRVQLAVRWCGRFLLDAYIVTAAVWLFTLPIMLGVFHLAAPIGLLVNVILVPYSALLLGAGFLLMGCALLLPEAAFIPGAVFDLLLSVLNWIVSTSAATPLGHFYVAGPGHWWLIGWYGLLAVAAGVIRLRIKAIRAWQGLGLWTVIGLTAGLFGPTRDGLTCTVLSVGHGGAILLELPHGRTLLYDIGVFGAPERAERVVQQALWEAGVSRLDGLVISHADSDHYNGAQGLLHSTPIASLLLSQSSVDVRQLGIAALCEDAARSGTAIRLLWSGDRLRIDRDVEMEVLHPPPGPGDPKDNANSIVVCVRYAGRSLLLTGDLEGAGLAQLLSTPAAPVDVLLSPHHGANDANPPALARWCTPGVVAISTGNRDRAAALAPVYGPDCRILSTANHGALRVHITPKGTLTARGYLDAP